MKYSCLVLFVFAVTAVSSLQAQEPDPYAYSYRQYLLRSVFKWERPADGEYPIRIPYARPRRYHYGALPFTLLNGDTWQAHSGWWEGNGFTIRGRTWGDSYLTLLQEHPDDFRFTVTARLKQGQGLSVWFAGSKQRVEFDGYFFSLHANYAKFQRKTKDVLPFRWDIKTRQKEYHTITIERIGSEVRAYKDADPEPVYVWKDPRPLRGRRHRHLGLYLYQGRIEVAAYSVEPITEFRGPREY